ncbi:unnamed protein product [Rhizopus stolonifer]
MQIHDPQRHTYPEKVSTKNSDDEWTVKRVILWLEANDFRPAVDFFKANKMNGKAFLDIDMPYLTKLRDKLPLSNTEKNRLAYAIQTLRQSEYHPYNRHPSSQHTAEPKTPMIPERKSSSNNEKVSSYVNTPFTPTISLGKKHGRTLSNTIGRHSRNENEGGWKLAIRRPCSGTEHQQSIHVTKDSDTFHSLQVTGMFDPRVIKMSILRKLGLGDPYSRYLFFHENGKNPNVPLGDEELSHICQISDHSSTNRILVKHILEQYKYYHKDGTEFRDFVPRTRPNKSSYYNKNNNFIPQSYGSNTHYSQENTDPVREHVNRSSSRTPPMRPQHSEKINYVDTPYHQPYSQQNTVQSTDSAFRSVQQETPQKHHLWNTPHTNRQEHTPSLWAVPPNNQEEKAPNSLWAVPPNNGQKEGGENTYHVNMNGQQQEETPMVPKVSLWAVPPNQQREEKPAVSNWSIQPSNPPHQKGGATSLWAVPPNNTYPQEEKMAPTTSLWAVPPSQPQQETKAPAVSLWAVHPNNQQQQEKEAPSLWAVPPNNHHEGTLTGPSASHLGNQNQEQKEIPTASLWAVPPNNAYHPEETAPTVSLWAVHPDNGQQQQQEQTAPTASLWAVPPNNGDPMLGPSTDASETPSSLWAVPPKNNSTSSTAASSLWAVTPKSEPQQFSAENLNLHPSISNKTDHENTEDTGSKPSGVRFLSEIDTQGEQSSAASAPQALEDGIEQMTLGSKNNLQVDTASQGASPPSPSSPCPVDGNDEDNWAERPSVERLYKDIDRYLPGHDLDKEIIEAPTPPVYVNALPPGRKLQGHKKSIRNVANEAHRNWKSVITVVRANNLMRRRNTKMWHRAVEQVKPGMKSSVQQPGELPKSKKLQWIRGELIGKGSFGRVYHALNVEAGEWIAVKQVDIPNSKSDYSNPQLTEIKDGLFREISLLEDLDYEYIVQYLGYNVDEEEGHINIFLEYVPGGSVASCLSKTGKFEIPLVQFFTRQILLGLAYLHNRDIMHRDIKAGNILLDENGICKITDFGLSKLSGQDKAYDPHSNNSVMRGTVFWMAPEVVKGTNYNAKVDIWSLGCTVIEMLTGSHPWLDLNMLAALYNLGKYQAPPIPEDFTEDTRDFLNRCFTINPEERPTAEQLLKHPFVQTDPTFEFKKYMKKAEVERRASRRKQLEQQ